MEVDLQTTYDQDLECSSIDDIEDIAIAEIEQTRKSQNIVNIKKIKKVADFEPTEATTDNLLPGRSSIFLKTWGCSHNNSDSEYMAGILSEHGYSIVDDEDEADLWILNSCTVKNPSEQVFVNSIAAATEKGKKLVLAGCVPQAQQKNKLWLGYSVIGVQQIDRVVEVVEETLKGHIVQLFKNAKDDDGKKTGGAKLSLPKIRKNPIVEIIPINTGCLNQCTYCKTKQARGNLGSYSPEEIIDRAIQVFNEGVKKILLTSEDTGAYGKDIGVTLPALLRGLVNVIPDGCTLRIGMTNPPYILEYLEEIAEILNHPKVFSFLHIPIQSASDRVLYDMKREYNVFEFKHIVDFLREKVPDITIATDIICGFPGESEEDFEETMKLVEEYKFPVLHISQFYARPGTPAARMERLPSETIKQRSRKLTTLFNCYTTFDKFVGQEHRVLISEYSADKRHLVAHNKFYHQVLISCTDPMIVTNTDDLIGKTVDVKLVEAAKFHIFGELTNVEPQDLQRGLFIHELEKVNEVKKPIPSKQQELNQGFFLYSLVVLIISFVVSSLLPLIHPNLESLKVVVFAFSIYLISQRRE